MKKQRKNKQDMKNTIKSNKAITLIALVVTIVVLLILAAVSINMLTGENGIIRQAQEARNKTKEAGAKEQIEVEVVGSYGTDGKLSILLLNENLGHIEGITHKGKALTEEPITSLPATVELEGVKVVINGDGSITEPISGKKYDDETDITVDGTPVTVPGGATISGIEEETTIEEGLVIYIIPEGEEVTDWEADSDNNGIIDVQEKYDQFVWVPVPNAIAEDMNDDGTIDTTDIDLMIAAEKYPMAIATDSTNYRGVLYDFTETGGKVVVSDKSYSQTSGPREPAYLTDADGSSNNNVGITESSLQTEFNTMVNRVSSKKGFWVGRYETSNMSSSNTDDSTQQIKVTKGTTTGIASVNWYRMYAQQKNYSKLALGSATTATSSMIWGSQWDQIMIWMKTVKNTINTTNGEYYVTNAVGMGNYGTISGVDDGWSSTSAPAPTGYQENYKVKNIYDLAGNVWDWILEANITSSRVDRRRRLHLYG